MCSCEIFEIITDDGIRNDFECGKSDPISFFSRLCRNHNLKFYSRRK